MGDNHEGSSLEHGRVRDLTVPRASSVPTGRMTAGSAFWGRWSSVGWGAPRAPLALEVRVLGGLPERREG